LNEAANVEEFRLFQSEWRSPKMRSGKPSFPRALKITGNEEAVGYAAGRKAGDEAEVLHCFQSAQGR
jgi:hypothetical protein